MTLEGKFREKKKKIPESARILWLKRRRRMVVMKREGQKGRGEDNVCGMKVYLLWNWFSLHLPLPGRGTHLVFLTCCSQIGMFTFSLSHIHLFFSLSISLYQGIPLSTHNPRSFFHLPCTFLCPQRTMAIHLISTHSFSSEII